MIAHAEPVMGTVVSFLIDPRGLASEVVERALADACAEFHRLDDQFSLWKPDSELSRRRAGTWQATSELMREVETLCAEACELSRGFFDPWALTGGFDPTGLVKGWAVERSLVALASHGVSAALVNAGGDIAVLPNSTYRVGVRHPERSDALCGVVAVDSSIATSGVYERGNHLVHPFGGDIAAVSATVVGGRLALADALATALAIGGTEVLFVLEQVAGVEGFFITADGALFASSGMTFCDDVAVADC